jgi:hypothetical protein
LLRYESEGRRRTNHHDSGRHSRALADDGLLYLQRRVSSVAGLCVFEEPSFAIAERIFPGARLAVRAIAAASQFYGAMQRDLQLRRQLLSAG